MSILHGYRLASAMRGLSPKTTVDLLSLYRLLKTPPQKIQTIITLTDFPIRQILLYIDSHHSSPLNYTEC